MVRLALSRVLAWSDWGIPNFHRIENRVSATEAKTDLTAIANQKNLCFSPPAKVGVKVYSSLSYRCHRNKYLQSIGP